MAHAIAQLQRESLTINPTGYEVTYMVTFVGDDAGGQSVTGAQVAFDFADDNNTLRAKVRRGVETAAQETGVTVEAVQADLLLAV